MQDAHALLGVSPAATEEEIRRAYRMRAKVLHPDHCAHLPQEERMRRQHMFVALAEARTALLAERKARPAESTGRTYAHSRSSASEARRAKASTPAQEPPSLDSLLEEVESSLHTLGVRLKPAWLETLESGLAWALQVFGLEVAESLGEQTHRSASPQSEPRSSAEGMRAEGMRARRAAEEERLYAELAALKARMRTKHV